MTEHHLTLLSHVIILTTALINLLIATLGLIALLLRLRRQDQKLEQIHTDVKNGNGKEHE